MNLNQEDGNFDLADLFITTIIIGLGLYLIITVSLNK